MTTPPHPGTSVFLVESVVEPRPSFKVRVTLVHDDGVRRRVVAGTPTTHTLTVEVHVTPVTCLTEDTRKSRLGVFLVEFVIPSLT